MGDAANKPGYQEFSGGHFGTGQDRWGNHFITFLAIDLDLAVVALGNGIMVPVHATGIWNARLAARVRACVVMGDGRMWVEPVCF